MNATAPATIARRCADGPAPPDATVIVFGATGQARRLVSFGGAARVACAKGETAWCFRAGPYAMDLVPFAAAPEVGLRIDFVIDAADPRLARQRFDLFLYAEVAGSADSLSLHDFAAMAERALRGALEQGTLALPPCTLLDEWNAFRGGLNELLYMRFGVTVDDCVPVDLEDVDYAGVLRERIPVLPVPEPDAVPEVPALPVQNIDDAAALRRLFLELPEASATLRLLPAPAFAARQALLQRLSLAALDVNTMPALALSAPGRPLALPDQRRRAAASAAAVHAMDELWALLAQMKQSTRPDRASDDELERIVANVEFHLAARRAVPSDERREPTL